MKIEAFLDSESSMSDRHDLRSLQEVVVTFSRERGWDAQHSASELVKALAVEVAELLELLLWKEDIEVDRRTAFAHEMADVAIYLLLLADLAEIDLGSSIEEKLRVNSDRFPR